MIDESVGEVIKDMDAITKAVKDLRKQGVVAGERAKFKSAFGRLSAVCGTGTVDTASAASEGVTGGQSARLTAEQVVVLDTLLLELIAAAGDGGIKTADLKVQYLESDVVTIMGHYKDKFQSRLQALKVANKVDMKPIDKKNKKEGSIITLKS